MTKREFLQRLETRLREENIANVENVLDYYDEMISDRMEDGMGEEEAVAKNEDIESIVNSLNLEKSMPSLIKDTISKKHTNAKKNNNAAIWTIILVLGFPIWFPLLITYLALVFSFVMVLLSLIIAYFAVAISFTASSVACFFGSFTFLGGNISFAGFLFMLGSALLLGGISAFMWFGAKAIVKAIFVAINNSLKKAKGGILCINR